MRSEKSPSWLLSPRIEELALQTIHWSSSNLSISPFPSLPLFSLSIIHGCSLCVFCRVIDQDEEDWKKETDGDIKGSKRRITFGLSDDSCGLDLHHSEEKEDVTETHQPFSVPDLSSVGGAE